MKKTIIASIILATLSSTAAFAKPAEISESDYTQLQKKVNDASVAAQSAKTMAENANLVASRTQGEANKAAERATDALNSASAASTSERNAKTSEKNAETSARSAKSYAERAESAVAKVDDIQSGVTSNAVAIDNLQSNVSDIRDDIANNNDAIEEVKSDVVRHDDEILSNKSDIKDLQSDVADNSIAIDATVEKVTENSNDIARNKKAIVKTQQVAKDYTDQKAGEVLSSSYSYTDTQVGAERTARIEGDRQTLQSAKAYTNQKFAQLSKRIDKVSKSANAGTASALAAGQIPQVEATGRFSLGAGVGTYNSQSAVAVGFSTRLNNNTVAKVAVTSDTAHNFGAAAGVAVSW